MEKIILDCDPGHDDAVAILLAAGSPEIDLLAVTTVAGNQTLSKVTRNAMSVCAAGGIAVPIAAGAAGPLVRPQHVAEDIHGDTGLDGPVLPPATTELDTRHAVDVIIDLVMSHEPRTVHLVPTGPLTNIALAIRKEPRIVERVKSVVLMGGAYTRGNVTASAEFNIYVDPEAAEAVLAADWDVTMVGLDLTHQATATPDVIARIAAVGGPLATFVTDILGFFRSTYLECFGFPDPPVHDACCVAKLIDASVFTTRDAFVTVELAGTWTTGTTYTEFDPGRSVAAVRAAAERRRPTKVAIELDKDRFWDLVINALENLSAAKD